MSRRQRRTRRMTSLCRMCPMFGQPMPSGCLSSECVVNHAANISVRLAPNFAGFVVNDGENEVVIWPVIDGQNRLAVAAPKHMERNRWIELDYHVKIFIPNCTTPSATSSRM